MTAKANETSRRANCPVGTYVGGGRDVCFIRVKLHDSYAMQLNDYTVKLRVLFPERAASVSANSVEFVID